MAEEKQERQEAPVTDEPKLADVVHQPTTKAVATTPKPAQPSSTFSQSNDDDDDDAHPDEQGIIRLPLSSFTRRVERATRKTLRELFGTDNKNAILEMKKELDSHRESQEESRRKSLEEIERMREDITKEREAREEAELRAFAVEQTQLANEYDSYLMGMSEKYIQPKYYRSVANELREFLLEQYVEDAESVEDIEQAVKDVKGEDIEEWFAEYAKEHPEIAVASAIAALNEPVSRNKLTNGNPSPRPTPGTASVGAKDVRPGRPNSMSGPEFQAYLRQRGLSY